MNFNKIFLGICLALPCFSAQAQENIIPPTYSIVQSANIENFQIIQELETNGHLLLNQPLLSVDLKGLPPLKLGDESGNVSLLRTALTERGFAPPLPVDQNLNLFDEDLQITLQAFQRESGLNEDGVAGKDVYAQLSQNNHQAGQGLLDYANFLKVKIQEALAAGHAKMVVVNIPSYELKAIDLISGKTEVHSRVIVGLPGRRTPIFTTNIVNLKYNPDWSPPPSLAKRGKKYVKPGPNNPMGRIRFSTDNNIHIYLHHTNDMAAFEKNQRSLSSGCVRVEQWEALASFLVGQSEEYISEKVNTNKTIFEKIPPVPVIMAYSLNDVSNGQVNTYKDIYSKGGSVFK